MPAVSSNQLTLDFQPGLAQRYTSLLDCCRDSIYKSAKPLKTIAADMDQSPSDLSRKLAGNPDDPRRYTVEDLEKQLALGDHTPIYYLIDRFLADEDAKRNAAVAELLRQLPNVVALAQALQGQGRNQ